MVVRSHDKTVVKCYKHHGLDAAKRLVDDLERALQFVRDNPLKEPIDMTLRDKENFDKATACQDCKRPFTPDFIPYQHHDHATGKYIAALCNGCNLRVKPSGGVPCLVHNLAYDLCSFIRELGRLAKNKGRSPFVIAPSGERIRYLSFESVISFIDTTQYVHTSLQKLVKDHKDSQGDFSCLSWKFGKNASLL